MLSCTAKRWKQWINRCGPRLRQHHHATVHVMKPSSNLDAIPSSTYPYCTKNCQDASRYIAWVSAACAIVWGVTLGGFVGYGSNFGTDGTLLFMLYAIVLHIGQAVASAISFKFGACFGAFAFVIAVTVLIGNIGYLGLFATPLTCSACALIIARGHALSPHRSKVG